MKVAFVDPANITHYYNLSFVNSVGRVCKLFFFTSQSFYETLCYPKHVSSSFLFFRSASYLKKGMKGRFLRRAIRGAEYPLNYMAFVHALRNVNPDLVHLNWSELPEFDLPAIKWIQSLGFPVLYTAHNAVPHEGIGLRYSFYKEIIHTVDHVVCLTEYVKEEVSKTFFLPPDRVSVVPHGDFDFVVNQAGESKTEPKCTSRLMLSSNFVISFFGLIRPYKGLEFLIKALPAILRKIPNCILLVFGPATAKDAAHYEAIVAGLGVSRSVVFDLRYVPLRETVTYLKHTDVAVLPYVNASQSGNIPMLSKMGIPVIATHVGGIPEMIQEGINGLLVPPRSPEAISEAVCYLLGDDRRLERMKIDAVEYATDSFSWEKISTEMKRVYEKVLGSHLKKRTHPIGLRQI